MTEDGTIRVNPADVFAKYRLQTEQELSRLRYALAQAETAIDTIQGERDQLRSQISRGAGLPSLSEQLASPDLPPDATREFSRQL